MPSVLRADCPAGMSEDEWCLSEAEVDQKWPGSTKYKFHCSKPITGKHIISTIEKVFNGTTTPCHSFTDGYYCHELPDEFDTETYMVSTDGGARFGVMCHSNLLACHVLACDDTVVFKAR